MSILINPTIYENTNYIKDPLIHLSFNNNIIDVANNYKYTDSNHIGTHYNHTVYNNSSLVFDGVKNVLECNSIKHISKCYNLTFGCCFLPYKINTKQYLIYIKKGLSIFINEDNCICIKLNTFENDKSFKYALITSKEKINMYNWNNLVCTYITKNNNNYLILYINNKYINCNIICGYKHPFIQTFKNITFGCKDNSYYYNGLINQFFISPHNYKKIQLFYNTNIPYSCYNICQESTNNILYDINGNVNGTIYDNVSKLQFDGIKQHIKFDSEKFSNLQSNAFSISLSIYRNLELCENTSRIIISNLVWQKANGFEILYEKNNKINSIKFKLQLLGIQYIITSPLPINMCEWNDLLFTYNGYNCIHAYHNNKLVGYKIVKSGISNDCTLPTYLGGNGITGFPGIINNIKIYDKLICH